MDWGGVRNAKLMAGVYLAAFVSLYGGLGCELVAQWTGWQRLALGAFAFVAGLAGIFALAWVLRDRVPARTSRLTARAGKHQRAYQRLVLGIELAPAWRILRG